MTDRGNWGFVIAAYGVAWIVILGCWVHVHRALRRARSELEQATAGSAERT